MGGCPWSPMTHCSLLQPKHNQGQLLHPCCCRGNHITRGRCCHCVSHAIDKACCRDDVPFPDPADYSCLHVGAAGCCAEFVVRRDRIHARPRQFYADLLRNLNKIPPEEGAPAFALEHSWHAIFVSALPSGASQQSHQNLSLW
jgi:Protein of unknown function (DUF3431)